MAFSGDYAEATITNPASSLTDFTVLIDLSRMPADWWAAVDTSDGTKGRVVLDSGPTEVASDWINFDDVAETGWVRAKWAGTLATSGTQVLRVYPPKSGNTSYAEGDTFGQHNAYDSSWAGYWPDGGGLDRTSNSNDGTAQGSVTVGGVAGQVGDATSFDGTDDAIDLSATLLPNGTSARTTMGWHKTSTADEEACISYGGTDGAGAGDGWRHHINNGALQLRVYSGASSWGSGLSNGAWHHTAVSFAGGVGDLTDCKGYTDGTDQGAGSGTQTIDTATTDAHLGEDVQTTVNNFGHANADLDDWQAHSVARSAEWIEHEYEQSNDQATFWGTWTWTTVGGGGSTPAGTYYHRFLGAA